MPMLFDRIQELRSELADCCLTRRERTAAEVELEQLLSEQAVLDRAGRCSPRLCRPIEATQPVLCTAVSEQDFGRSRRTGKCRPETLCGRPVSAAGGGATDDQAMREAFQDFRRRAKL